MEAQKTTRVVREGNRCVDRQLSLVHALSADRFRGEMRDEAGQFSSEIDFPGAIETCAEGKSWASMWWR